MTFRVGSLSTLQFNMFNRRNVQNTTLALQRAGQEVSTGRKADIYADLGPRSASVMKLRAREADTQTYMQSNAVLGSKLEAMMTSVDSVRGRIQSVLEVTLSNATRPQNGAEVLQREARAALESLVATMNTSYNGDHLFSGLNSDVPPLMRWDQTNPATSLSPEDVLADLFGAGPTDAASATAIADAIDAAFDSADLGDPNRDFEATFYNGSPELDGGGSPTKQVNAWVNTGQEIVYGVRANDEAFREAFKGLAMLATTDISTMDEAAYGTYMNRVVEALTTGQEGMLDASARIGFNQQIVETTQSQLVDLSLVQRTQISQYESVDPYEAITRMQNLENQLEASYQVSARLSGLSILNFLR
ncbi:flagellar hook protein [Sulfitobacter mediterraneus]|uniref:Flagellin n=1 Tax=Sulfitobacter mediterraneus TaxID=83219 RepID=A0A061SJW3_9RHOB|nr:flagellin [Sulfitobacter mediterraneus]KAJ02016.1 flagellar hook protein [Sulfitobacter mediterraneus]MBM1312047.1 flagellar hook protein [Sulfitobacter mediterraneus]MBM1315927.1 flagellar hook protein [Sulfitobacter mediterraneus]MBM1324290.1 flagellar hook protein [Sulfitobacter mediterraneus]MBM1328201.1 flagellar hook protein [Sulfitobacter mediterraneus]